MFLAPIITLLFYLGISVALFKDVGYISMFFDKSSLATCLYNVHFSDVCKRIKNIYLRRQAIATEKTEVFSGRVGDLFYIFDLLPPPSAASQNYDLRPRRHDRQLPARASHLMNCEFITRLLYKDIY